MIEFAIWYLRGGPAELGSYNHTNWQRLTGQPSHRVATGRLYVISRPGATVPAGMKKFLRDGVGRAKATLDQALIRTRIGQGKKSERAALRPFVEAYFRLPADASDGDLIMNLTTIGQNLQSIKDGLSARGLELVDVNPGRAEGACGYVRMGYSELFRARDPARPATFTGRIHVDFGRIARQDADGNAALIIHEAAHKFLGARDWCYLPSNDGMKALAEGFQELGVALTGPFWNLTNQQGLNNADSYPGYVREVIA